MTGAMVLEAVERLDREWVELMRQAQELGLGKDEVRAILRELQAVREAKLPYEEAPVLKDGRR